MTRPKNSGRSYWEFLGDFYSKCQITDDDSCWLWAGSIFPKNPPRPRCYPPGNRNGFQAHRLMWILRYGEIPLGKFICHHCDNTMCVRPSHLFLGDQESNMDDMVKKGRSPHSEKNPRGKLNTEQVQAIRLGYSARYGEQSALAKQYGVTPAAICKILHGENWYRLPLEAV